jgi:HSP20 family protein
MYLSMNRPAVLRSASGEPFNALVNEIFSDFFTPSWRGGDARPASVATQARLDVLDKGDRYEALVEMPGVHKQDVEVRIDGSRVNVSAEAKTDQTLKDGERVVYSERIATRWARSFELPTEVDDTRAEASYENGVLKLSLPKKQQTQPKKLAIK